MFRLIGLDHRSVMEVEQETLLLLFFWAVAYKAKESRDISGFMRRKENTHTFDKQFWKAYPFLPTITPGRDLCSVGFSVDVLKSAPQLHLKFFVAYLQLETDSFQSH